MNKRAIRIGTVREKLGGCSEATVWRRVHDGVLPKPFKVGGMTCWLESDIDAVIDAALAGNNNPEAA